MAIFKTYETFLNYSYFNLCCRESQVILKVYTNNSNPININRTAVYSGDVFLPNNLLYLHCDKSSDNDKHYEFEYTLVFEGIIEQVELIRFKLVFCDSTFYNFDCYRNGDDIYTISEMIN